jgi:hypothetical protein
MSYVTLLWLSKKCTNRAGVTNQQRRNSRQAGPVRSANRIAEAVVLAVVPIQPMPTNGLS